MFRFVLPRYKEIYDFHLAPKMNFRLYYPTVLQEFCLLWGSVVVVWLPTDPPLSVKTEYRSVLVHTLSGVLVANGAHLQYLLEKQKNPRRLFKKHGQPLCQARVSFVFLSIIRPLVSPVWSPSQHNPASVWGWPCSAPCFPGCNWWALCSSLPHAWLKRSVSTKLMFVSSKALSAIAARKTSAIAPGVSESRALFTHT